MQQGFLPKMLRFNWDSVAMLPAAAIAEVDGLRTLLRLGLVASAHPWLVSLGLVGVLALLVRRRK